jgi:hypothetical protein
MYTIKTPDASIHVDTLAHVFHVFFTTQRYPPTKRPRFRSRAVASKCRSSVTTESDRTTAWRGRSDLHLTFRRNPQPLV